MKTYELTVVIRPTVSSDKMSGLITIIEKAVKSVKGKVVETEDWGERQLAYTIEKRSKGNFRHFVLELPGDGIATLESKLKLIPEIMRSLLVVR